VITIGAAGVLLYSTTTNGGTLPWTKLNGAGTMYFLGANSSGYYNPYNSYSPITGVPNGFTGTIVLDGARINATGGTAAFGGTTNILVKQSGQLAVFNSGTYGAGSTVTLTGTQGWRENDGTSTGQMRFEGGAVWAGNVVLAADARIGVSSGGPLTGFGVIAGNISGAHTLQFGGGGFQHGQLTLAPTGGNTFTGVQVNAGAGGNNVLVAGTSGAFPTGTPAALTMNGGTLQLDGFNFPFADLSGTSGQIQNGGATPSTLTAVSNSPSTTYNGTLVDGGAASLALTMAGSGSLTLTGSNTYTGGTTVNNGTLIVTNNGAIADGTSLAVGDPSLLSLLPAAVVPAPVAAAPAVAAVPEPGALLLAAFGVVGTAVYRRLRRAR
jgi:autotransporter-associated beta strand protein